MLLFLKVNGIKLIFTQEELEDIFLRLAASEITFEDLTDWIITHEKKFPF